MLFHVFEEEDVVSSNGRIPVSVFGGFVSGLDALKRVRIPEYIKKGRDLTGPFTRSGKGWHGITFFMLLKK